MSRPRVVDCFPFNNELDMLECRLTELYDAVDAFVLVEARVDHQDHEAAVVPGSQRAVRSVG
jgi:flavin reductase (DIM6/NTAB) family NADH-FMN oxidoreductase RutF